MTADTVVCNANYETFLQKFVQLSTMAIVTYDIGLSDKCKLYTTEYFLISSCSYYYGQRGWDADR